MNEKSIIRRMNTQMNATLLKHDYDIRKAFDAYTYACEHNEIMSVAHICKQEMTQAFTTSDGITYEVVFGVNTKLMFFMYR